MLQAWLAASLTAEGHQLSQPLNLDAHSSFLVSLAQVNNFDLANSLDLLAQLETEQTGHRKHLQQVIHALEGAALLAGICRARPAGSALGAISCIIQCCEPLAAVLLWVCMILAQPWQVMLHSQLGREGADSLSQQWQST